MNHYNKPAQLSLLRAWSYIFLSICAVLGSVLGGWFYYNHLKEKQKFDPAYNIVAIAQSTQGVTEFNTAYFAELLELSADQPMNLYAFDTRKAEHALLSFPVIKKAAIKKIRPGMIHIDYTLRKPIAFLGDYTNTAIDSDGIAFPIKPFFTPKKLPEIFLGRDELPNTPENVWGSSCSGSKFDIVFSLMALVAQNLDDPQVCIQRIDVSRAYHPSQGQRQIVIILEEQTTKIVNGRPVTIASPYLLRLSLDNYRDQLANYLVLRQHLKNTNHLHTTENRMTVVDLRLSDLAFISLLD